MKYFFYFLLFSTVTFFGCQNSKNELQEKDEKTLLGTWRLADIELKKEVDSEDALLQEAKKNEAVKNGMIYNFFADGTFTFLSEKNLYSFGNWKLNEEANKLTLIRNGKKEVQNFNFEEAINDKASIQISSSNSNEIYTFIREAKTLKNYKEDPFYPANNLWRLKAQKSENKIQITDRLGNFFKHTAYILKASEERKQNVVSFEFSLGIIKIYNGGIGIEEWYNVPQSWKETFYNENEALIARDLFSNYLQKSNYHGASTGNWVKDDCDILTSIYGDLKAGKF